MNQAHASGAGSTLIEVLVAIFVMGIIINHISREFASTSTEKLSMLKD